MSLDHCIFLLRKETGIVVLVLYVDDILVSGSDTTDGQQVKTYLKENFPN